MVNRTADPWRLFETLLVIATLGVRKIYHLDILLEFLDVVVGQERSFGGLDAGDIVRGAAGLADRKFEIGAEVTLSGGMIHQLLGSIVN